MEVVTADEMHLIDRQTIDDIGIPGIVLMEHAGRAVALAIQRHYADSQQIGIFVGKGNNGGDGLVLARHLAHAGYSVEIFLVSPPIHFCGDALKNLKIAQNLELPIVRILSKRDLHREKKRIIALDLIVDSIFGTGFRGIVRGYIENIIQRINDAKCPVMAIDLPSGLNPNTGSIQGACVHANLTITIGLPKRGLILYPGAEAVGELQVADIGLPRRAVHSQGIQVNWTQQSQISEWVPTRRANSHKGTYGRVFVLAGSTGMSGAATLASKGALRAGAGLVTLGLPESLNRILETKVSEVMTLPLPETTEGSLALSAKSQILDFIEQTSSVLAIGPGLSRHPETVQLVHALVYEMSNSMVIDADALNALSDCETDQSLKCTTLENLLSSIPPHTVLTPHPGEMSRLTGRSVPEIEDNRIEIAQIFARTHELVLVLKGVPTVVVSDSGEVSLNSNGNPGMATAGMGDVLTGVIAGLIAQGVPSYRAAVVGVYLHGLAGDISAELTGLHGLMAEDVLDSIPKAITLCMAEGQTLNETTDIIEKSAHLSL